MAFAIFFGISCAVGADCASVSGKTIEWIVPSKPGGGYDAYSRLLQPFLEKKLGARILIQNRSAAGGLVGAMTIRDAPPDGTTLGIINAPGLLAANFFPNTPAPDPRTDFSILGTVASSHVVMLTATDSGISDIDSLLALSRTRPLLVGIRDAGSSNFIALPITASLLGFDYALVTGYVGSGARTLAAMRGEIDIIFLNFDAARRHVEADELLPLLQISDPARSKLSDSSRELLAGVPTLSGAGGIARQRASVTGRSPQDAAQEASAAAGIFAAGRLIVAPPDLPETLGNCYASALDSVFASAEFVQAANGANLSIDTRNRDRAGKSLSLAAQDLGQFEPAISAAIDRARR